MKQRDTKEKSGLLKGGAPASSDTTPKITYDLKTGLNVPFTAVLMVYITIFFDTFGATVSTPALPFYAKKFGASTAQIGYMFAAWSFTSTFCAPLLGWLSDKIGRRPVLLMSLIGAGSAAFMQGFAWNYWIMLFARGFSGIWAAVGSTCNVYITDVASPQAFGNYAAKLSVVPGAAMLFGPTIGGGLSTFGLNVPIIFDGSVTFLAALLVFIYLPETPSWLNGHPQKKKEERERALSKQGTLNSDGEVTPTATPMPMSAHVLGIAQFLNGIAFGSMVSMTAVSLGAKFGFEALEVGYVFGAMAIVMLGTGIFLVGPLQKRIPLFPLAVGATVLNGVGVIGFGMCDNMWLSLGIFAVSRVGVSVKGATASQVTKLFTDPTNRGTVFANMQFYLNLGRLFGPLIAGHLAAEDPIVLPWLFAGGCSLLSAVVLALVQPPAPNGVKVEHHSLAAEFADVESGPLKSEVGSKDDVNEMGQYLADLLTRRNYRWVSHKDATKKLLDMLLPELHSDAEDQLTDLDHLLAHAEDIDKDFHHKTQAGIRG